MLVWSNQMLNWINNLRYKDMYLIAEYKIIQIVFNMLLWNSKMEIHSKSYET